MDVNLNAGGSPETVMPPASMQGNEGKPTQPLKLFIVTLPWAVSDVEEGDYCNSVWAQNHDEAIRLIAEEMSQLSDSGCTTDTEREQFVSEAVANASQYAASCVAEQIAQHLVELMSGTQRTMTPQADTDLAATLAILAKYGVTGKD